MLLWYCFDIKKKHAQVKQLECFPLVGVGWFILKILPNCF